MSVFRYKKHNKTSWDRKTVVVETNGIWVNVPGMRAEAFWDVGIPKPEAGDQSPARRAGTCNKTLSWVADERERGREGEGGGGGATQPSEVTTPHDDPEHHV